MSVVNLYKTVCPQCGTPTDGLMSGNIFYAQLPSSGQMIYAQHNEKNKARNFLVKNKALSEFTTLQWIAASPNERVPGKELCKKCEAHKERVQLMQQEVEAGGVAWRCEECGNADVVTADYLYAQKIREESGIKPPEMCALVYPNCAAHKEAGIYKCQGCGETAMIFDDGLCGDCYDSNEDGAA